MNILETNRWFQIELDWNYKWISKNDLKKLHLKYNNKKIWLLQSRIFEDGEYFDFL